MKKLYMSFLGLALCVAGASAQQTVFIGETGYDNLTAAVAAAEDGSVITVTADQTFDGKRIDLVANKSVTIKGENGAKLVRGAGNKSNLFFLLAANCTATFENLIFDGGNVEGTTQRMIELNAKSAKVTINNCTFQNATNQVMQLKGTSLLNNVTVSDCSTPADRQGNIYVGENNVVTMQGEASYDLYIEKGFSVAQGESLTGKVGIYIASDQWKPGYVVVKSAINPDLYSLLNAPEGYSLVANEGNLELEFSKPVVKNETTGNTYSDLVSACNAAAAGDVIVVLEDVTLTARIIPDVELTIKGLTGNEKIVKMFNNSLMFSAKKGLLTIRDITLDCNNKPNDRFELELDQANMNLENVAIINSVSSKGLIQVKAPRILTINNVTKSVAVATADETEADTKIYDINMGYNSNNNQRSHLLLAGNNNLSIYSASIANEIKVNGALSNETPIELFIDGEIHDGDPTVDLNGYDAARYFTINGYPMREDGIFTGIESIAAGESAPLVSVYNMQGVCVRAAVEAADAAAGLPAGLYIIGGKKVIVK